MQQNQELSNKEAMTQHKANLYLGIAAKEFRNGKTREEVRQHLSDCSDHEFIMICKVLDARKAYDKAREVFNKEREAYLKCIAEKNNAYS